MGIEKLKIREYANGVTSLNDAFKGTKKINLDDSHYINPVNINDNVDASFLNLTKEQLENFEVNKKFDKVNINSNVITEEMLEAGLTDEQLDAYTKEQCEQMDKYIEQFQTQIDENNKRLEELKHVNFNASNSLSPLQYNVQQIAASREVNTKTNGYDGSYSDLQAEIKQLQSDNIKLEGMKSSIENQKLNFKENNILYTKDYKEYLSSLTSVKEEELDIKSDIEIVKSDGYNGGSQQNCMFFSVSYEDYKKTHPESSISLVNFYEVASKVLDEKSKNYDGLSKVKIDMPYNINSELLKYISEKDPNFVSTIEYLANRNPEEAQKYIDNNKDKFNKYEGMRDAEAQIAELSLLDDENIKKFTEEYANVDFNSKESIQEYLNKIDGLDIDNKEEIAEAISGIDFSNRETIEQDVAKIVDMVNGSAKIEESLANALNVTSDGLYDGLYDFGEGFAKLTKNGEVTVQDYKAMIYMAYLEEHSNWYSKLYQGSTAVGNMLPSITASALVTAFAPEFLPFISGAKAGAIGQNVALALNAVSSFGTTQNQLKYEGYEDWRAYLYAGASSLSEVATEKLFGGILGISDAPGTNIISQMINEGKEEALQQIFQSGFMDTLILGKDFDFGELTADTLESFVMGATVAGALNGYTGALSCTINGVKYNLHGSDLNVINQLVMENPDMPYSEILDMVSGENHEASDSKASSLDNEDILEIEMTPGDIEGIKVNSAKNNRVKRDLLGYTMKERFANKNQIKNIALLEVYKKYGNGKLLGDEINRRASENIEEVRDFYQNYNSMSNAGDIQNNLNELSVLLKLSPVELLDWDCFTIITDDVAYKYLTEDDSWLDKKNIAKKVSKEFLYNSLTKNENIYKHSELIPLLNENERREILLHEKFDYSRIPNIIEYIDGTSSLISEDLQEIAYRFCTRKNYDLLLQFLNLDRFEPYVVEQILSKVQDSVTPQEFLMILDSLSSDVVQYISNDSYYFEKMISPYMTSSDGIEAVLNTKYASNLNDDFVKKMIFKLPNDKMLDILVNNNDYYEMVNDEIDLYNFREYFDENIERYIARLTTSNLCDKFFHDYFNSLSNSSTEKFYQGIMNDVNILKHCLLKWIAFVQNYICEENCYLSDLQQENITEVFQDLQLSTEQMFQIFDRYGLIKEKAGVSCVSSMLKDGGAYDVFNGFSILDRYPEIVDMIDLNLIFNLDHKRILRGVDKYQNLEVKLMNDDKFLDYILTDKDTMLKFMPLINKYGIDNPTIRLFNDGFKKIQEVRPELSWGNSSLRVEMFDDNFINTLGVDYIDAILQYDSDASSVAVDLYTKGELNNLKIWLDYLSQNISESHRMIHYYIMAYSNMEELSSEIISENIQLDDYQKQILEEVVDNGNLYEINSVSDLNNYFQIKAEKILNEGKQLSTNEIKELFFNISSLEKGVPWKLNFNNLNLDYIKYKYVSSGVITAEEYDYLRKVTYVINNSDMTIVYDLVSEYMNKKVPTARSIINKIRSSNIADFKSKLLDLDDVRKNASYTDPNAKVYIEIKDGIEYIYLNDYDFICLKHNVAATNTPLGSSTLSFMHSQGFEQYTLLSEKIKEQYGNENLGRLSLANLINDDPQNWNLIEGISTVSTGIYSSRYTPSTLAYAWGRKSNINPIKGHPYDAQASHEVRNLNSDDTDWNLMNNHILYGTQRGEIVLDRFDDNNERIQPEFIIDSTHGSSTDISKKAAKYFDVPIVIGHSVDESKMDMLSRERFLQNYNVREIDDILFNHKNNDHNEKVNFVLNALKDAYSSDLIDYHTYISKLNDLKWKLYESRYYEEMERVDSIISSF